MEQRISIERMEEAVNLFGSFDENIRLLETEFQVQVVNRGGEIVVSGEPENVMLAVKAVQALLTLSNKGENISDQHVRYVIGLVRSGQAERISELTQDVICITSKGRPVKPKTIGQKEYVNAILKQTVTIGVGPAGTGKTYLAVAAAVAAFRDKQVKSWAFCPVICSRRWTLTCALSTMACSICWALRPMSAWWKSRSLRLLRWHICADARWMIPLSSWMRRRTLHRSR